MDGHDVSSGRTLAGLLEQWAGLRPREPALVHLRDPAGSVGQGTVTWERLATDVHDLRRKLAAIGVQDGRSVVLALPNSPLTVALWLAIPANGAIVQAVDPDSGLLTVERALRATEPVAVVAAPSHAGLVADAIGRAEVSTRLLVPSDDELWTTACPADLATTGGEPPSATPDLVAGLLPTSGTSGAPKLVQLTHRNYVMSAERLARNGGYLSTDRHYLCSPFFHTNAQLYLCAPPFVTGGSIAVVPRFSASTWFDAARRTGATIASMVAPPMRMALHRAVASGCPVDPGPLRAVHYGMTLSSADWREWDRLVPGVHMRQIYGQTESVTGVLRGAPWESDDRATIGRPFLGVDGVRLVRDDGSDAPDGEPGELWVRGSPGNTLMRGYLDAAAATAGTLVDGEWLRTGDIMVRHPNGRFEFRGRGMHIIRRGGENLSTYALEIDLQACPLVRDVAVTSRPDEILDAVVVAHVIPAAGYEERSFRAWCREHLGRRGVPDEIREHASFPRTGSGRVIVREL
ncbi:acyl--CoA ligase [Pseudonocardia kujensis]|uniref:class I adenylate-forming enzyme family protein n=1 Tax=Pseudonocardia kujensis TaxID=1128675 RepID=UPI001E441729|nr:class I adenylate-forming enzyme family protein [Pseudonocardia kujensis]MCE0767027.1 acyl--CoA ligase [Pseudonocardia kujensis]